MSDSEVSFENGLKKCGWVMKKSTYRQIWKKTWLLLDSSSLSYSKTKEGPFKQIPLYEVVIEKVNINEFKHVFRLKPAKSNKEYLFQVSTDDEEHSWMQSICFAKVSARELRKTSNCVLQ